MPKKNLIEEALIEAKELEQASIENAKDIVLESFTPDFIDFFKDVLSEGEDMDDEDYDEDEEEMDEGEKPTFKKGVKPDFGKNGDDEDDEDLEEGNEHDMGKEPDPGRQGTDPAVDDSEETLKQDDKDDPLKEGYDDVSGDPTPEKGQAGLPKKGQPKTKKVGAKGWESEHSGGEEHADTNGSADPEKAPGDLPGKKPAVKQTGDGGWEDEGSAQAAKPAPREKLKGVPKPPVKMVEGDEEDAEDEDKELEVPEELFKEGDSDISGKDKDDDVDLEDNFDGDDDEVEINIDVEDDDSVDENADPEEDGDEPEDDEDEEISESLYVHRNGEYMKITPAEYLTTRIDTLEEENSSMSYVITSLQGQLQETHLFNAKLAHLNKLFMTGAFTNAEKERIAEKLDECEDISDVKSLYKTIISEVQETNPLDDFSKLIKETRASRSGKSETIYESNDVSRMRRLMNYEFED